MTTAATRTHLSLLESGRVTLRTIVRERSPSGNGGHSGLSHRIEVAGQVFESKNDARRALKVGTKTVLEMLASVEARDV